MRTRDEASKYIEEFGQLNKTYQKLRLSPSEDDLSDAQRTLTYHSIDMPKALVLTEQYSKATLFRDLLWDGLLRNLPELSLTPDECEVHRIILYSSIMTTAAIMVDAGMLLHGHIPNDMVVCGNDMLAWLHLKSNEVEELLIEFDRTTEADEMATLLFTNFGIVSNRLLEA